MKMTLFLNWSVRSAHKLTGTLLISAFAFVSAQAQQIQWGLTVVNINNPIPPIVVTNGDGSISITAGGGDTYTAPDSFTYAYQQVTGDFDIRVRVMDVEATDPVGQDSPKASLMVRTSLDPASYDFMINALPLAPSGRDGQLESIGRVDLSHDTDDLPGRGSTYGGDTTDKGYCTYPDLWLRIQRQGDKFMSYFATTNKTDFPPGSSPLSTNGWQLLVVVPGGTNFPKTVYVGLSTVAHNSDITDTAHTVTSTYASYGPTPNPPSVPTDGTGAPVAASNAPGPFPNRSVRAINWQVSLPADGMGYPSDIVQSNQAAASPIIWNSGGFAAVARDEIVDPITEESPDGFSVARYQAGSFDFMISPLDPALASQNLGPYSNPARERFSVGSITTPASQAYAPSPKYGFAICTVRKNGQVWNDQSPFFYAATYVQLDGIATGAGYDMIGGHFRGGQFYTRTTKLVTGAVDPANGPASGKLQRCAVPISLAYFPYDQGWKAGYFDRSSFNTGTPGTPTWKHGDGWGLHSGAALSGINPAGGQSTYNSPRQLLTWVDTTGGGVFSGLAILSLPGVNSVNDGMLFTVGNDENNGIRGPSANNAALPDGSGWYVAVRDIETSKSDPTIYATSGGSDAGSSFSFLYIPWNADTLIAGQVGENGVVRKSAGTFSLRHLSSGRYALSIPGKSESTGLLLLQNSGYLVNQPNGFTNVVDNSFLSYANTPANAFIIETRYVDTTGGGEGVVTLRDAEFNFVYVDFQNPLAPPGTSQPVLAITKSGNNVVVSWSNGPGFMLQQTSSLAPGHIWADVGTANPSVPIPVGGSPLFFRVKSP